MDKPESLFDVRVQRRNLARGVITQEELDAMLAALPDDADKALRSEVRVVRGAVDDHSTIADED